MQVQTPTPTPTLTPTQTLRIPRGLWVDLEQTIIHQDRQFLTEVARSLGLNIQEVLRKCLGSGTPQSIPVLGGRITDDPAICPWWSKSVDGLWTPCERHRMSATQACEVHRGSGSVSVSRSVNHRLGSDKRIADLPELIPVNYEGEIYWIAQDNSTDTYVYREDGTIEEENDFRFIRHRGKRICVQVKNTKI